jgi:hypothetical protein
MHSAVVQESEKSSEMKGKERDREQYQDVQNFKRSGLSVHS